jgi:diacylglycerol kinase family enzyme
MQGSGRMFQQKIALHKLKTAAVLNRSSGNVTAAAEATMIEILAAAGVTLVELHVVEGGGIEAALDRVAAAGVEALIVLGGDGTIRTAAEKCSASGMHFIALPGGTMNMLPRALYGERTWQQALHDTVAAPHAAQIGCGEVEGNRFFCGAIFGTPAHWVEAREALRRHSLFEALERGAQAWRRTFSRRVRYDFGAGATGAATAVAVLCPLISRIMPSDAPALEAAALDPKDLGDAFSLALSGLFTDWRRDGNVTTVATRDLKIAARRPIPALLDGEMVWLPPTAEIRFVPEAFQALVPEGSPVLASRHEEAV